jgi:hypothetical protein
MNTCLNCDNEQIPEFETARRSGSRHPAHTADFPAPRLSYFALLWAKYENDPN